MERGAVMAHIIDILISNSISFIMPLILGFLCGFFKHQITRNKRQDGMLLALGQYRLMRNCERYLGRGYITIEELTSLETLFKAYKGLDGNGVIEELYHKCKNLEVRKDR